MKVNDRAANTVSSSVAQTRAKELEKNIKSPDRDLDLKSTNTIPGSSKVNMSSEAQAYQKAKSIASADTIDEAKVARLQKLIDEGNYKMDSQAIADRLVDEQIAAGD